MDIIFRDFFMFDQIFLSPQVKQSVIINKKHGMYVLHSALLNNLKVKNLFHIKTKNCFKYFVDCLCKHFLAFNLFQTPLT